MATTQVRVDTDTKTAVDARFSSLGLGTSTAIKIGRHLASIPLTPEYRLNGRNLLADCHF